MSVRELVFEYTTKGARAAARADQKVRDSVRQTGRTAERNAGSVQRWMDRSRKAVQMMAAGALAFAGAIASASPTLSANLGAVRSAVALVADQIVRDLLPSGNSLASLAIDLARKFTNLDDTVRTWISRFAAVGTLFAAVALAAGPVVSIVTTIWGAFTTLVGVLGTLASAATTVIAVIKLVVAVLATILGVSFSVAAAIVAIVAAVGILAVALITDFKGIRSKGIAIIQDLVSSGVAKFKELLNSATSIAGNIYNAIAAWFGRAKTRAIVLLQALFIGARKRFMNILARARTILAQVRDAIVQRITAAKDRVLELLSLGRDMAEKGKEWIAGLARGVRDRASDLVSSFRDMATRAANALKSTFNAIMPDALSIPRISVDLPDALGGRVSAGPWSIDIPQLNTGGRITQSGLAVVHSGERIMPRAQVRERGPQPTGDSGTTVEEVTVVVMGSGNAQADGRNVARAFQRELEDRGA